MRRSTTQSQRVAAGALTFAGVALVVGAVAMALLSDWGFLYGLMLAFGAFVSLVVAAAARHWHDAVRLIAWVASIILTLVGVGFSLAPASHMLDPGP